MPVKIRRDHRPQRRPCHTRRPICRDRRPGPPRRPAPRRSDAPTCRRPAGMHVDSACSGMAAGKPANPPAASPGNSASPPRPSTPTSAPSAPAQPAHTPRPIYRETTARDPAGRRQTHSAPSPAARRGSWKRRANLGGFAPFWEPFWGRFRAKICPCRQDLVAALSLRSAEVHDRWRPALAPRAREPATLWSPGATAPGLHVRGPADRLGRPA